MPDGLKRFQRAESLHFLTFSCYHRLPYLRGEREKDELLSELEMVRARHRVGVYAYVVMPEHVHLLVNEPPAIELNQWVKVLKQGVSRRWKGEREQFWQRRYYDRNIRGEDERTEVIRYIHRNPVKRGLVEVAEAYRWSSFRHYGSGEQGVVEVESEWAARWRGSHPSR